MNFKDFNPPIISAVHLELMSKYPFDSKKYFENEKKGYYNTPPTTFGGRVLQVIFSDEFVNAIQMFALGLLSGSLISTLSSEKALGIVKLFAFVSEFPAICCVLYYNIPRIYNKAVLNVHS